MSSILQTRLPLAQGETVSSDVFNRMIRILELNLSAVDINISPHFNATEISELQFATGAVIFNTTLGIHQAFDGTQLRDLYSHQTYPKPLQGIIQLGTVTVTIS